MLFIFQKKNWKFFIKHSKQPISKINGQTFLKSSLKKVTLKDLLCSKYCTVHNENLYYNSSVLMSGVRVMHVRVLKCNAYGEAIPWSGTNDTAGVLP